MFAFDAPQKRQGFKEASTATTLLQRLNRTLAKSSFSSGARLDFYRVLLLLLDNQVRLNEALKELYRVYSYEGKRGSAPVAVVIADCLEGMNNGISFTGRLADWVPAEEGMLLQSGEASGQLAEAFNEAEKIMEAKKQIVTAVTGAIGYPIILIAMTGFLLNMIATELVPQLAQVVDPSTWTGSAAVLNALANFTTHYGLLTVGIMITLGVLITYSLPRLNGPLRIWLDSVPPWSIYRMVQGSTFLLNVSAMIKSGMQLNVALTRLAAHANPWLKLRITSTLQELAAGKNFGEALRATGYHFPDQRANRFLSVIAEYSGLDQALAKFGRSWLAETVQWIQRMAKLIMFAGILTVGGTMLLIISGTGGLQDAVQAVSE